MTDGWDWRQRGELRHRRDRPGGPAVGRRRRAAAAVACGAAGGLAGDSRPWWSDALADPWRDP